MPKTPLLHGTLLILAIVLAFGNVINAGFISWDDLDYLHHHDINSGITFKNACRWFTSNYLGNYQPLPIFTYAMDYTIGGNNPKIFHLHNLLWHVVATLLVYVFVGRLQENKWVAFFTALLFAVHPVQTESVSWIAARNKSMNTVFYLLAMCQYISYVRSGNKFNFLRVVIYGLLAYLCKATALALPLALFAVDIWLKRPLRGKKIIFEKIPLVLIGIPFVLITIAAQEDVHFLNHHNEFQFSSLIFAGYAICQYIFHLLLPINLSVLYPYPGSASSVHYVCFVAAICIVGAMCLAYVKQLRFWAAGLLFFLVNLLPVLQLVQFGETLMADRYLYIASIGLWIPLVKELIDFDARSRNRTGKYVVTSICIVLVVVTSFRNNIWLNEFNFWNSVLEKFPKSSVAHYSIGAVLLKEGKMQLAEKHIIQAIDLDSKNHKAWYNLGSLRMRQNNPEQAVAALNRCIEIEQYPRAYLLRAMAFHKLRMYWQARNDANQLLACQPSNARAYYIKADCDEQLGKTEDAIQAYNKAIEYDKLEPLFLIRRGILQAKNKKRSEAISDLDKAVALKPASGESFYYRALVRYSFGQSPCDDLHEALSKGYYKASELIAQVCK